MGRPVRTTEAEIYSFCSKVTEKVEDSMHAIDPPTASTHQLNIDDAMDGWKKTLKILRSLQPEKKPLNPPIDPSCNRFAEQVEQITLMKQTMEQKVTQQPTEINDDSASSSPSGDDGWVVLRI
ncbi:hypothetical protein G7Y89_g7994 [Cudoniella acicularis]|uniref:Uncharacterized protein n=1 Tax=Cudoniella acicularis TaxID=354080 RepID=A0A8H4W1G4_9HELO|nr:hypothetical protein G7Y89_g7994 [Cudoniella acicularis]